MLNNPSRISFKNCNRYLLLLFIMNLAFIPAKAQLVSYEFLMHIPVDEIQSIPGIEKTNAVDAYKIIYNTEDLHGNTVTASGLVVVPSGSTCNTFGFGVYCHGTVLMKYNVPSRGGEGEIAVIFASSGFVSLAPDYLGLGDSPGLHPYLHGESEALATINMIRATKEFVEIIGLHHNGETFITGYSQGGHVSMATMKYAEENNLTEELGIIAGAPCSGSYNLSQYQVLPVIMQDAAYGFMGYGIYFLLTFQNAYGDIFSDYSEIFQSHLIADIEKWYDGEQNSYSMGHVNNTLPNKISQIITPDYLNELRTNGEHPLWKAVQLNDNYDWKPAIPLRLYYCDGDEQVSYLNSLDAELTMTGNGATDVKAINIAPGANHASCAMPALVSAYLFFKSMASDCTITSTADNTLHNEISIFPNPAKDMVSLSSELAIRKVELIDLNGRLLKSIQFSSAEAVLNLSTDNLSPGLYFVRTFLEDGRIAVNKLLKE